MKIEEITPPIYRQFSLTLTKGELIALVNGEESALDNLHELMTETLSVLCESV